MKRQYTKPCMEIITCGARCMNDYNDKEESGLISTSGSGLDAGMGEAKAFIVGEDDDAPVEWRKNNIWDE